MYFLYDLDDMLMFLNIVKQGYSRSEFLEMNLGYSSIYLVISAALSEELVEKIGNEYQITVKGLAYIKNSNDKRRRRGLERSLPILRKYITPKLSKTDIYVP